MEADVADVEGVIAALTWFAYTDVAGLDRDGVRAELNLVARMRGVLDVKHGRLTRRLNELAEMNPAMFPDADIADSSRSSRRGAEQANKRATTLGAMPELESALGEGGVSADHVDVLGNALRRLHPADRERLAADGARLAAVAARSTPEQFDRFLRQEIARLDRCEGAERSAKQKQANRLRSWSDAVTGMLHIKGEFDPETGLWLMGRLEAAVEAMFHSGIPDDCPTGEGRQDYLRAMALIALLNGRITKTSNTTAPPDDAADDAGLDWVSDSRNDIDADASVRPATKNSGPFWPADITSDAMATNSDRAEIIVVIDLDTLLNGLHEHSLINNGHGLDLPVETYRRMACDAGIIPVVMNSDGVALDEGRRVRLATRNQRRALRAMYTTCAIPGCRVHIRHCRPHHIAYWSPPHRGPTNLSNLLPVCNKHHHALHEGGWKAVLHPDRSLTITYLDGTTRTSGPPSQERAA